MPTGMSLVVPLVNSLVALRAVTVRYPHATALDAFSLAIRANEVVALIGPSGCGKSTALRALAGLVAPDGGAVEWADPGDRDRLGIVFQSPTLMPWADAGANVALPLRLAGMPKAGTARAVADALSLVGLEGASSLRPHELSGGMAMRVAIARALAVSPRLILMDEPFAALDEIARHRLNDELLAIRAATGCAVLFVTHSVTEAAYLADRVAVMAPGGRLHATLDVPFGERDRTLRAAPAFAALTGEVSDALAAAMGEPPSGAGARPSATPVRERAS